MPKYVLFPQCERKIKYRLENHTSGYDPESFPSFMTFDALTNEIVLNGKNLKESGHLSTFKLVASEDQDKVVNSEYTFTIKIPENKPPQFEKDLTK